LYNDHGRSKIRANPVEAKMQAQRFSLLLIALALSACATPSMFQRYSEYLLPIPLPESVQQVDPEIAKSAGHEKFKAGDFGASVVYFQQAAAAFPDNSENWLALAAAADRAGRFDISRSAYEKALSVGGPVFEYYNNVGFSYVLQGRLAEAERALIAALNLKPYDETVLNNIALLQRIKG
jgi:Tfp pilus assembly protein PilF